MIAIICLVSTSHSNQHLCLNEFYFLFYQSNKISIFSSFLYEATAAQTGKESTLVST